MLLRYPGGKSRGKLASEILSIIKEQLKETGCKSYCEPFFGGGGIAFMLLKDRAIEHLAFGDLDYSITRLWNEVISHPDRLKNKVTEFKPNVDGFRKSKERILDGKGNALDTIIASRLSHGGRGVMASPQGGYKQEDTPRKPGQTFYPIGCRWNPDRLCKEIQVAHNLFARVKIYHNECLTEDYKYFLDNGQLKGYLFYLDPPYYKQGKALYRHGFEGSHKGLAGKLEGRDNWVLSYDNCKEVQELYTGLNILEKSHAGNGGMKLANRELIITPFQTLEQPC